MARQRVAAGQTLAERRGRNSPRAMAQRFDHGVPAGSARELLTELTRVRGRFLGDATATKLALLAALERTELRRASQLADLHDQLLFLRAFPDDRDVLEAACRGLAQFAGRMRRITRVARARLEDSGVAGSVSRHTFEAPIARWLSECFPDDAEIDWAAVTETEGLEVLFTLVALRAEHDALESPAIGIRGWLRRAHAGAAGTNLAWLMRQLRRWRAVQPICAALYDQLNVPIVWRLGNAAGSATHNLLPVKRLAWRAGFRSPPARVQRWIATPLRQIRRLPPHAAARVLDVTRAALTARCREVYALAHANVAEVYFADLGEGAALAIYGVTAAWRLSLESNYGYLLLSNGVPIGYGGVTLLFRQANTGINIFEAFRGSEAAFLCAQSLRAFATLFGTRRFIINPYQIGQGNHEAIASGAFWFYYRLGFRPVDPGLKALADAEWELQRAKPGYRVPAATLRRFASDDLELALPDAPLRDRVPELWLGQLALRASDVLARAGGRHRGKDADRVSARVARVLGARGRPHWPAAEREAFAAIAPLVSLLDLASLSARARARLVKLMRNKGAPQERAYALAVARNPHFVPGLMTLTRSGGGIPQSKARES
jgi:hypothetical protein